MIKEQIKNLISSAVNSTYPDFTDKEVNFSVGHPADISHGDYYTNISLIISKDLKKSPKDVAVEITEKLKIEIADDEGLNKNIEKVEIAGPGFINFYLKNTFYGEQIGEIIRSAENFGKNKNLNNLKTVVEFTDPNPFKEFHIGHLMSNSIGESVSRIIEANGAELKRACYQGDVGLHVAKAIWGYMNSGEKLEWGKAYALGSAKYSEDGKVKKEIEDLNKVIYEKSDEKVNKIYDEGRKFSLEYFDRIYKKLGTKFDFFFYESETGVFGKKIVEDNIGKIFEKSDGATIFKGEEFGLHTRVFISSQGLPTYEAKELGLSKIKYDKYPYEKSIVVTANEINDYFRVLLKAMELVFPDLAKKTLHLSHGMLRLPSGKMSSRTGDVITAESLIDKIKEVVAEKIKDRGYSDSEKEEIMEKVSVGALKYSILRQAIGGDIIFDFDKSISFEGDSGPYLQYAYARANSVLEKAESENIKAEIKIDKNEVAEKEDRKVNEISHLEKIIYQFGEVVERAGDEYAPHYIATYLIEIAGAFNSFYAKEQIVNKDDENSAYKVAITKAFSIVMKNGLNLLGIPILEKM